MKRRLLLAAILGLAVTGWSFPVSAGGWAIAELVEPVPAVVTANEEIQVDIRILQHGLTPVDYATPVLTATHRETATTLVIDGEPIEQVSGGYRFGVAFPVSGDWKWHVTHDPFPGMTAFPTLSVIGGDATPAVAARSAADAVVTMINQQFSPIGLEIPAGTTVTWINTDAVPHQVASASALWFDDSPMLQPGESYEFTFQTPGEFEYVCGPHPGMSGVIRVT